jgi:hypothetical protein
MTYLINECRNISKVGLIFVNADNGNNESNASNANNESMNAMR